MPKPLFRVCSISVLLSESIDPTVERLHEGLLHGARVLSHLIFSTNSSSRKLVSGPGLWARYPRTHPYVRLRAAGITILLKTLESWPGSTWSRLNSAFSSISAMLFHIASRSVKVPWANLQLLSRIAFQVPVARHRVPGDHIGPVCRRDDEGDRSRRVPWCRQRHKPEATSCSRIAIVRSRGMTFKKEGGQPDLGRLVCHVVDRAGSIAYASSVMGHDEVSISGTAAYSLRGSQCRWVRITRLISSNPIP